MSGADTPASGFLAQTWRWLKDKIVGEVPPEVALCEFDCRKGQCTQEEWANCERRLSRAGMVLLSPLPSPDGSGYRMCSLARRFYRTDR